MASRGLNKVLLIGNLGADPEMRYTPSGKAVTTFRLAVNRSRRDQSSGEQQRDTQWFTVVAWENLAEICSRYLSKGKQVYVEGRLQTRTWDKPDGSKGYATEVVAQEVILLGAAGAVPEAGAAPAGLDDNLEQALTEEDLF